MKAAANPAAPDTSGEASPTRVASPPHEIRHRAGRSHWIDPACAERIRALEAELASERLKVGEWTKAVARAEAAEAELSMERGAIKNRDEAYSNMNAWWGVEYRKEKARAEAAEARVRELEKERGA